MTNTPFCAIISIEWGIFMYIEVIILALIKSNTAYSVNDIVNTKYGIKLTCTTAGTTSTGPLILDGTSPITDGTVVWEYNNTGGGR